MKTNVNKTKSIIITTGDNTQNIELNRYIIVGVKSFKHLETTVDENNDELAGELNDRV